MPASYHTIAARGDAPLLFFGDHSSAHIPKAMQGLGISPQDRARHIAVDIGTEGIIHALCREFGCAGHLAGVSRLVIDCNRDLKAKNLIPTISDGTHIPGNASLTATARQSRIDTYYAPYHDALGRAVDVCAKRTIDPLIVSMHSFTTQLRGGDKRGVEIGFLVKADPQSANDAIAEFATISYNYDVRINEPYSAWDLNYTVDRHVMPRGLRHLYIEVRQDFIATPAAQSNMADILSRVIGPVMRRSTIAPR
ncbi:N-formylglutamate amidohydrolase [Robiginitomaculum antarcticum]|uniref:N-formylglutamate amidohydrolase n=1 Tax=Robiginitomaculum antarcticum TaxID=437507 RepID=UPI000380C369|nr:N-formylglutamate amidohydrolase [Robiginitomaculum antarcticum]